MELQIEVNGRVVSRPGFGAMRVMGARSQDGRPDRSAAVALVRRAVELGVNFIDTADIYGNGQSEEIVAESLYPYPDDVLIATKGGFVPGDLAEGQGTLPHDGRPEHLRQVCEESLRRLRVERIDLYQLHAPDPAVPFEESVGALIDLQHEGKIAGIGLSNVSRKHIASALTLTSVATVQNRYNHHDRTSERVLEFCEERGIVFLPWAPILTGPDAALEEVAREVGAAPPQVALAWLLHRSPFLLPIPGTSSVEHLEENVAAAAVSLDEGQLARLASTVPGT